MRRSEPALDTNFCGSRQTAPRLSTSKEPSDANSVATGPFKPRAKVRMLLGASGSSALIQCFMKSAKKKRPRHFSGNDSKRSVELRASDAGALGGFPLLASVRG